MAGSPSKITIVDAVREQENLYMLLYGDGGTGKTLTALLMALRLVDGDASKILFVDTDTKRSRKYGPSKPGADDGIPFRTIYLDEFKPDLLIEAFAAAREGKYEVVIVDSFSKFWNGPGGLLELNEMIAKKSYGGNTQAAWSRTNAHENAIYSAIDHFLSTAGHVFLCCQEKLEYKAGTLDVVGVRPEFRGSLPYRVDYNMRMTKEGSTYRMTVEKSTATRLKVDGTAVDMRPIVPIGTSFDNPQGELVDELMSFMNAAAQPVDHEKAMQDFLAEVPDDRGMLLQALETVAAQPWPRWVKTLAREKITTRGRHLKEELQRLAREAAASENTDASFSSHIRGAVKDLITDGLSAAGADGH